MCRYSRASPSWYESERSRRSVGKAALSKAGNYLGLIGARPTLWSVAEGLPCPRAAAEHLPHDIEATASNPDLLVKAKQLPKRKGFSVLTGNRLAKLSRRSVSLRAGVLVLIERGERHEIRNVGTTMLRTLNLYCLPAYTQRGEELPRGSSALLAAVVE